MVNVTMVKPVGKVVWKMRSCMARRKVSNASLAKATGIHPTTISRLKSQDRLPEVGSDRIEQIRAAIESLSKEAYGACSMSEILEVVDD